MHYLLLLPFNRLENYSTDSNSSTWNSSPGSLASKSEVLNHSYVPQFGTPKTELMILKS